MDNDIAATRSMNESYVGADNADTDTAKKMESGQKSSMNEAPFITGTR